MTQEEIRTHAAVNATTSKLLDFEKQFKQNSIDILVNISRAHDELIKFVKTNDLSSEERIKVLQGLIDIQTADLLKKLDQHNDTTTQAFNNTRENNAILKENNIMGHEILNILRNYTNTTVINEYGA